MIAFSLVSSLPAAGVGFVVGAFTPAIGRKIKSWFVKETTALKTDVTSAASTAASDVSKKL